MIDQLYKTTTTERFHDLFSGILFLLFGALQKEAKVHCNKSHADLCVDLARRGREMRIELMNNEIKRRLRRPD